MARLVDFMAGFLSSPVNRRAGLLVPKTRLPPTLFRIAELDLEIAGGRWNRLPAIALIALG
jgi:hypothetical protein